ncbi:hypothetical protein DL89DRAFT_269056 [Linderina pennispora]|uniref:Uncharacterized protein n=1 Tax=Linderina pennispora TaxID=61395 RepID=A0A1Y1W3I9_9FUNG|nr:uncharacterized protein DL89DRAFT_269056 [Linderina pennispora]ORX67865.1 hypothetical protein DL89DRAFT_269056 [Linderina pennispora]
MWLADWIDARQVASTCCEMLVAACIRSGSPLASWHASSAALVGAGGNCEGGARNWWPSIVCPSGKICSTVFSIRHSALV